VFWGSENVRGMAGWTFQSDTARNYEHNELGDCLLQFGPQSFVCYSAIENTKTLTYKTVIVPLVPYSYVNRPLTLRKKYRLKVFANSVLRKRYLDLRVTR